MTDQVQATPALTHASEFRRVHEKGEPIKLPPTGRLVQMRTVKPAYLLRQGKIPNPLAEFAMRALYGQLSDEDYKKFFSLGERAENAVDYAESLRIVCTAALIHPRIVDEPQADDEIHIDHLEDSEQRWIFDLAFLEATGLSRFRQRQEANVEPVLQRQEAEQPSE